MTHHTALRRYRSPQLMDRGRITEQTLMSNTPVVEEGDPKILTFGASI